MSSEDYRVAKISCHPGGDCYYWEGGASQVTVYIITIPISPTFIIGINPTPIQMVKTNTVVDGVVFTKHSTLQDNGNETCEGTLPIEHKVCSIAMFFFT